jgi:K+-sensing histidine kinase KdpD
MDVIFRNAKRLRQLTENILDVARIESQLLDLNKEQFNLNDVKVDCINDAKMNKGYYLNKNVKFLYAQKDDFIERFLRIFYYRPLKLQKLMDWL